MADAGKFMLPVQGPAHDDRQRQLCPARRCEAGGALYLRRPAEARGVKRTEGIVTDVADSTRRRRLDKVILKDGREVAGDFIDRSGLPALLIGKTLGEPFRRLGRRAVVRPRRRRPDPERSACPTLHPGPGPGFRLALAHPAAAPLGQRLRLRQQVPERRRGHGHPDEPDRRARWCRSPTSSRSRPACARGSGSRTWSRSACPGALSSRWSPRPCT